MEPGSVDWPLALSHLYRLLCNRGTLAQKRDQARKSFKVAFRAIYLHRRFRRESYLTSYEGMVLSDLARLALTLGLLVEAKCIASKLMELERYLRQRKVRSDEYCAAPFGKHTARAICGKIHLANTNIARAEEYLIKMAAEPISFGATGGPLPDMELADELIKRGRSEAALQYLNHCRQCCIYQLNRFNQNPRAVSFMINQFVKKQVESKKPLKTALIPFTSKLEKFILLLSNWIDEIEGGNTPSLRSIV